MLSTTRAIINSINRFKYLKNINRVQLKPKETNFNFSKSNVSLDEIEKLENEVRVNNLKVFSKNYAYLALKRFWFVSLPALLTASSIFTFVSSSKVSTKENLPTYDHEEMEYNSNYGVKKVSEPVYVTDEGLKNYTLAHESNGIKESFVQDNIVFRISNNDDCLVAKLNITNEDKLTLSEVKIGNYFDFTEYNPEEYSDDEAVNFDLLYDKIVSMINEYIKLTYGQKRVLETLSADEKKTVVINVSKYVNLRETSLDVYKSKMWLKIALIIALIINLVISGFTIWDDRDHITKFIELSFNDDGYLVECLKRNTNIIYEGIRYKEAFLAAERERIKLLEQEINKNVSCNDRQKLLTRYESHLLAKEKKRNN